MIDKSLTQQEAKKYQISVSDEEVDNAVGHLLKSRSFTREELKMALAKEGITLEAYHDSIKEQILQSKIFFPRWQPCTQKS